MTKGKELSPLEKIMTKKVKEYLYKEYSCLINETYVNERDMLHAAAWAGAEAFILKLREIK